MPVRARPVQIWSWPPSTVAAKRPASRSTTTAVAARAGPSALVIASSVSVASRRSPRRRPARVADPVAPVPSSRNRTANPEKSIGVLPRRPPTPPLVGRRKPSRLVAPSAPRTTSIAPPTIATRDTSARPTSVARPSKSTSTRPRWIAGAAPRGATVTSRRVAWPQPTSTAPTVTAAP
jgi:hypothetical protein